MYHTFHIPVLGLAFSIDSPIKVAQYGISSVISIVDDELIENMRAYYASLYSFDYEVISDNQEDARAFRITSYLNLIKKIVDKQIEDLKSYDLKHHPEVKKYFELLPEDSISKRTYQLFLTEEDEVKSVELKEVVLSNIRPGSIDVNIMAKVDKLNMDKVTKASDPYFSDALAALRGFANSNLHSSVVLSAGMNPRLYQYISELPAFLPNNEGQMEKQVILKVSDYRSALIQAKYLAKKGVWISEFRIESGLNCGGHAFATDGYLLGPILEEFKSKRTELYDQLITLYQQALTDRDVQVLPAVGIKITVQGGIGTADEHRFLLDHYQVDGTGWGSPFLLVPEATTVDEQTLNLLASADADDFYISDASPLGVPFNNFKGSSAEKNRLERIAKGRPGAPCTKKYLVSNTEFGSELICTASRKYQAKKLKEISNTQLSQEETERASRLVLEKTCLCEGLASSAYIKYGMEVPKIDTSVAICPGPNISFFDKVYSLEEMVSHIYGRLDLLINVERPSMFINELKLYMQHLEKQLVNYKESLDVKKKKYLQGFADQVSQGIAYYRGLYHKMQATKPSDFLESLTLLQDRLQSITVDVGK